MDLIIVQKGDDDIESLRQFLQNRQISSQYASSTTELASLVERRTDPCVLVYCGASRENFEFVRDVVLQLQHLPVPMLLIGNDAESFSGILTRYFPISATLVHPCESLEVLENLKMLAVRRQEFVEKVALSQEVMRDTQFLAIPDTIPAPPQHPLFAQYKSVPRLIFDQMRKLGLRQSKFNTSDYLSGAKKGEFSSKAYLPTDELTLEAVESICKFAGGWGGKHLHRSAFVTFQILEALDVEESVKNQVKAGAFLYAWAFRDDAPRLLRRDFAGAHGRAARREVAERVKESAKIVAEELEIRGVAEMIQTMSRVLGQEETLGDETLSMVASVVLISSLVDRICWNKEYFDSRGLHRLMKRIQSGEFNDFHPAAIAALVSFFSHASPGNRAAVLVPKQLRHKKELLELAREIREQCVESSEIKVQVSNLAPGMKLTRPVYAFDGEVVLQENIVLDEDLIWRLWQLSEVRPLNLPLVVSRESHKVAVESYTHAP